jgi:hypothetical protein
MWEKIMAGWIDPKTQRATAFYALLGILCSNIWHVGWNHYNFSAFVLMTGLGTLSALTRFVWGLKGQKNPPPPPV